MPPRNPPRKGTRTDIPNRGPGRAAAVAADLPPPTHTAAFAWPVRSEATPEPPLPLPPPPPPPQPAARLPGQGRVTRKGSGHHRVWNCSFGETARGNRQCSLGKRRVGPLPAKGPAPPPPPPSPPPPPLPPPPPPAAPGRRPDQVTRKDPGNNCGWLGELGETAHLRRDPQVRFQNGKTQPPPPPSPLQPSPPPIPRGLEHRLLISRRRF